MLPTARYSPWKASSTWSKIRGSKNLRLGRHRGTAERMTEQFSDEPSPPCPISRMITSFLMREIGDSQPGTERGTPDRDRTAPHRHFTLFLKSTEAPRPKRLRREDQGFNVLAKRKPRSVLRLEWPSHSRSAARRYRGPLSQEPPRKTRRPQSSAVLLLACRADGRTGIKLSKSTRLGDDCVLALPFPGLPWLLSFQQSSVHSQTLPCTLNRPQGFASKLSTGTVFPRCSPFAPPPLYGSAPPS
jgi:hypothetical protein